MKKIVQKKSLKELAASWGIDHQVFTIKSQLVGAIIAHCREFQIGPRKLSSMVKGLSNDSVNKLFFGQVGLLTLDKLVEILTALDIKLFVRLKKE